MIDPYIYQKCTSLDPPPPDTSHPRPQELQAMASVTGVEWKIEGERFIMTFDDHINFSTDSEKK